MITFSVSITKTIAQNKNGLKYHVGYKAGEGNGNALAWKIPWTEEPGRLQSMGWAKSRVGSDTNERLHFHFSLACIGEGNGNPLQRSCLENPMDGGAW